MRRDRGLRGCPQAVERPFSALGKQQVAHGQPGNRQEEEGRWRNKAKPRPKRREGQRHRKPDHHRGGAGEKGMSVAAQRIAPRAEYEDDKYLGGERLDEPASLEQRLVRMEDEK